MRARTLRVFATTPLVAAALAVAVLAGQATASQIVQPRPGYWAVDRLDGSPGTGEYYPAALDVVGDSVVVFEMPEGLKIVNLATGSIQKSLGRPADYFATHTDAGSGYVFLQASFVTPDPDGLSFWVGFTNWGNTDDRIYRVDSDGQWTHVASLVGNIDLEFSGAEAFVSANPGAVEIPFRPVNRIYRLDTSGAEPFNTSAHDVIAEVGGYSAGLALDAAGNLYYGTYHLSGDTDPLDPPDNRMYRFSAAQLRSAAGDGVLSLDDADVLFDLPVGPLDCEVDDAGNLVFAGNGLAGGLIAVAAAGSAEYTTIATTGSSTKWLSAMAVAGDLGSAGGRVYVAGYDQPGLAEISPQTPGDANGDGQVSDLDASILAAHWQQTAGAGWKEGDFSGDGAVTDLDASILAAHWLAGVDPAAVPEPATAAMLLGGLLAGLFSRLFRPRGPAGAA